MSEIRAIPTTYNGVIFRSRLEASWAAHFDSRQLPWEYEPEGYELSDGTRYLPDFYLPTARAWVEVKGDHMQRMSKMEQFAAELWENSVATSAYDETAPMVLLYRTPYVSHKFVDVDGIQYPYTDSIEDVNPLGVMGPGKRYSASLLKCNICHAVTVIALWQPWCRNCRARFEDAHDDWTDWAYKYWNTHRNTTKLAGFKHLAVKTRVIG